MDIVFIRELCIDAVIGVHDWERSVRQTLVLDLEMAGDVGSAAASDAIEHALDYAAISVRIRSYIELSEFQLIETLAEEVATIVRQEFGVSWLRLRLCKPGAVARSRDVGVVIERGKRP